MIVKFTEFFNEGFSFKTERPTGKWKSFDKDTIIIKLNKKEVGSIDPDTFKIRMMVEKPDIMEDGNKNCTWKWITFKKESSSIEEAKEWLQSNFENISKKYKIHQMEE